LKSFCPRAAKDSLNAAPDNFPIDPAPFRV